MSGQYCDKCGYDLYEHVYDKCPPPFLSDFRGGKSLMPEDKDTRCGWRWFSLRKGHPFEPACMEHDKTFDDKENKVPTDGRRAADNLLLAQMLGIAADRESKWLKVQAYLMYGIARVTGKLFW